MGGIVFRPGSVLDVAGSLSLATAFNIPSGATIRVAGAMTLGGVLTPTLTSTPVNVTSVTVLVATFGSWQSSSPLVTGAAVFPDDGCTVLGAPQPVTTATTLSLTMSVANSCTPRSGSALSTEAIVGISVGAFAVVVVVVLSVVGVVLYRRKHNNAMTSMRAKLDSGPDYRPLA